MVNLTNYASNASSAGEWVKFHQIGDGVCGVIDEVVLEPDKFNPGEQQLILTLHDDDGDLRRLGARKAQLRAIADAAAGRDIEVGGVIELFYVADKDTGNRFPMKVYEATYTPPSHVISG